MEESKSPRESICTYIDHGIRGYPEEGGPLIDLFDLLIALSRQPQGLQLTEGALQCRAMFGYEVVARAQVLHLAREGPQGILQLCLISL